MLVVQSFNVSAIEPPNMNRISEADKLYFGTRLDKDQFDKLQRVINHSTMSRKPCLRVAEIDKTLRFIKEVTPVFQEAANRSHLSTYARTYSASLTRELLGTGKALKEILPHSKKACAAVSEDTKGSE